MSAIEHAHDQELAFTAKEYTLLHKVSDVVDEAVERGDQWYALDAAASLRRSMLAGGVAMAKLLYRVWVEFYGLKTRPLRSMTGEKWKRFLNDAHERTGLSKQTIKKYTWIWGWVCRDHPELVEKPIGWLWLITPAAKEDQLEDDDWKAIARAHNKSDIRQIRDEVRGNQTSSKTAVKGIVTPDGTIKAAQGDDPYRACGYLTPEPDFEAGRILNERIKRAAGLIEV